MIPVYSPYLNKEMLKYAHDAIDSTWISSNGIYLDKAKEKIKELIGSKYVILVNNGTAATHLVALGLKFKYPQIIKIVVPNNVYVAAWNSFLFSGGYDFIVKDANLATWNFDLSDLNSIPPDTAILAVHNLGNIINVPEIKTKYKAPVVEDNCEGFLGKYNGKYSGTESLISSVSFYGNKTITSGEGGAVFTEDQEIFEYLNSVRGQGQSAEKFVHDKLGYNYRMTNVQAALLYGQLLYLDEIIEKKKAVFDNYKRELKELEEVTFQVEEENTEHANWMLGLRFNTFNNKKKKELELFLFENYIETRPFFYTINKHTHLKTFTTQTNNAKLLNEQCLVLPSYPDLTKNQIKFVSDKIKSFLLHN